MSRSPFLNLRDPVNQCNKSTKNNFTGVNKNLTQFIKVLLVKLSDKLDSSNFARLFHCQSFALYGVHVIVKRGWIQIKATVNSSNFSLCIAMNGFSYLARVMGYTVIIS